VEVAWHVIKVVAMGLCSRKKGSRAGDVYAKMGQSTFPGRHSLRKGKTKQKLLL
jgi:hypothetical protein